MKFEESMQELEKIVDQMEKGNLSIDDSLKKFSEGIELCKACAKELDEAKGKVTILQKQMTELVEKPFKEEK